MKPSDITHFVEEVQRTQRLSGLDMLTRSNILNTISLLYACGVLYPITPNINSDIHVQLSENISSFNDVRNKLDGFLVNCSNVNSTQISSLVGVIWQFDQINRVRRLAVIKNLCQQVNDYFCELGWLPSKKFGSNDNQHKPIENAPNIIDKNQTVCCENITYIFLL